ncbi:two-partner secretion domain-containing protein [Zymobacter palmae]|uniref:Probable hemagglutinin-related protein n=1 Tax=Zymobacter palmae TaxID=33074 RepID=A0A348HE41_9GAMM|nr:hemagglutinin repeat-containing protein [Zymobacter palmae]BBG29893.1 probable hemagglutinin-related protein [Zymobacter palmae]
MNRHLYRIVFNKARGLLMVAAERTTSRTAAASSQGERRSMSTHVLPTAVLSVLVAAIAAGAVPLAYADIVADGRAPGSQQPTIIETASGRPQVNIQTPNAAGVSHNVYRQFDVGAHGAILNNSRQAVSTQLGGYVDANPWLSRGEARVILNEVNSPTPSQLKGWVEVAGRRADVVVANPSGIHCDGCGFINADRGMLTTGRPMMDGDRFNGVTVEQGTVAIDGAGLDARQTSHTDIIARAVSVNAQVHGSDVSVITGANTVDTRDAQHPVITPIKGKGETPEVALDVSALGGMYANRIVMVGTEKGVGVHNAGVIGASAGEVAITTNGQLVNAGTLKGGAQGVSLSAQDGVINQGKLTSDGGTLSLESPTPLRNEGQLVAGGDLTLAAPEITSSATSVLAAGVDHEGHLTQPGKMVIHAREQVEVHGKVLATDAVTASAPQISATGAQIAAHNVSLNGRQVDTSSARVQASSMNVVAEDSVRNRQGHWQAERVTVTTPALDNQSGRIVHTGQDAFSIATVALDNTGGVLATTQADMALTSGQALDNNGGTLSSHGQLSIDAHGINSTGGTVDAGGDLMLEGHGKAVATRGGSMAAGRRLSVIGGALDNAGGRLIAGEQIDVNTDRQLLDNTGGIIQADEGKASLATGTLINANGTVQGKGLSVDTHGQRLDNHDTADRGLISRGDMVLKAGDVDSHHGRIGSFGNLTFTAANVMNDDGLLQAGKTLALTAEEVSSRAGTVMSRGGDAELSTHALDNTGGLIQSTGGLSIDTHGQSLDNRSTADRGLVSQGAVTLASGTLQNDNGRIVGLDALNMQAGDVANGHGVIEAARTVALDTASFTSPGGRVAAGDALSIDTHGHALTNTDSGDDAGIMASGDLTIQAGQVDNANGYLAGHGKTGIVANVLSNAAGTVVGNGGLMLSTQALDNRHGHLHTPAALSVDTHGQSLDNREGTIVGDQGLLLDSGMLDNRQGIVSGRQTLAVDTHTGVLDNRQGQLMASGAVSLEGGELHNGAGQIQTVDGGHLIFTRVLDNADGGLIRANGTLALKSALIDNHATRTASGIESNALTLNADRVDNRNGLLRAGDALVLIPTVQVDNRDGLITANGALSLKGTPNTVLENAEGTLIGNRVDVAVGSLPREGRLLSQGDLTLDVKNSIDHHGELKANHDLSITTEGRLDNHSLIQAGGALTLNAQAISNDRDGEMSGERVSLSARDTLTHRGLIDGDTVFVKAGTFDNLGTGRLYGDHLAVSATTLNNLPDQGVAPVIAARERLDLATRTLINRDHALLYSQGDMAVGGALDEQQHVTGSAGRLDNLSASIEAMGNLSLAADEINNRDLHVVMSGILQIVSAEQVHEYQPEGDPNRYKAGPAYVVNHHANRDNLVYPGGRTERWKEYKYTRFISENHIEKDDPSVIRAGGDIALKAAMFNAYNSKVVAGQKLVLDSSHINNIDVRVQRRETEGELASTLSSGPTFKPGEVSSYWPSKRKKGGKAQKKKKIDDTSSLTAGYGIYQKSYDVGLSTVTYKSMQVSVPEQRLLPTSTLAPVAADQQASLQQASSPSRSAASVRTAPAITLGSSDAGQPELPETLTAAAALNTTKASTAPIVIRTLALDTTLPDSALFTPTHDSDSHYLIETDPRFTQYKQWLGTDYMRERLSESPTRMHKRLGDGFYEQQLVRDQVMRLTGQRYLDGFDNDDTQFKSLMNDGIAFANRYGLTPGVELSAEQMALLTSDIVWLVDRNVTLADGSVETVTVPQVYAHLHEGDLAGNGSLLNGRDVALQTDTLVNDGQIASRERARIAATDVTNSGTLSGNRVEVSAGHDLSNIGGRIQGQQAVTLEAGHDLSSASTFNESAKERYRNRQAGIYTESDNGALTLTALNNISLTASEVLNAGDNGKLVLTAGNDIALGTEATHDGYNFDFGKGTYSREATSSEQGSQLISNGEIQLAAGQDIRLKAADVSAQQGISVQAGRNVALSAGQETADLVNHTHTVQKGTLSKKTIDTHSEVHDRTALGTTLSGDSVVVSAGQDMRIEAGNVVGTQSIQLAALHDLDIATATEQRDHQTSTQVSKKGALSGGLAKTIGAYTGFMSGPAGWAAGKVLGEQGPMSSSNSSTLANDASLSEKGSQLLSQGNIALSAGQDVTLKAASVNAGQAINVQAGRDVALTTAQTLQNQNVETTSSKQGWASGKRSETQSIGYDRTATGTTLSGDRVGVDAGHDVSVTAGNIVGSRSVSLAADNDLHVTTAAEEHDRQTSSTTSKSGVMKSGVTGVMVGKKLEQRTTDSQGDTAHGSTVGASEGNTTLVAGKTLHVHGSDIVTGHDLALQGSDVTVDEARNRYTDITKTKTEQKGLTLAVTGMVGSMVEAAHELKQVAESDEDDRLRALQAISAVLKGVQAGQSVQGGQQGSTVAVSASIGQQKTSSEQTQTQDTTASSTLGAGNDLTVRAHGQQGKGDLTIVGSQVKAVHDIALDAARDIALVSSQDVSTLKGSNKSGGGSLGVSAGDRGLTVDVAANAGRGKEKGNSVSHVEATVDAGHDVALNSGRDALLQGAQVNGDRIRADIGRNLTLRSEQDEEEYNSTQTSVSGGVSAGIGTGGAQGSISNGTMDSSFMSVKEQSGLFAGKGGYDVKVGDHTQLDAAVIGSRAEADKNRLETGTLGFSDLENQLHFNVQQTGISGGTGAGGAQMAMGAAASAVTALMGNNGDDSSTTHAAVSQGDILIRDQAHQTQDIAALDRDVEHAANALTPLFDKEKEQQRLKTLQTAQTVVNQAIDIGVSYGEQQAYEAAKNDPAAHAQAMAAADEKVKSGAEFGYYSDADRHQAAYDEALKNTDAYANTMKDYGIGSDNQLWLQSGAHLVTGLVAGNTKGAIASAAAPWLAKGVKQATTDGKPSEQLSATETAVNALGHAVVGGAVASVSGSNAKAGAAGAAAGELAAHVAAHVIADGKPTSELTQSERERISQWGQVAGGVAGGLAGGGINRAAEIGAGAQAGKNAVENNRLTLPQMKRSADELAECMANYGCSTADVMAKWAKIAIEQELEYQKGNFSAPKEYAKDIAIPLWEAANHPVDTIGNAWTYTTDALVHPIENWDKLSSFKFITDPSELITKSIQARVENIGRYYFGNGGKEASYNAGVESGKLAIDVGSLFIGIGEVGGLRAGAAGVEKAASAAERVGLESAETAANAAKADRIAAEASIATGSSPKITITGTEPVKSLANSASVAKHDSSVAVNYVSAEQAARARSSANYKGLNFDLETIEKANDVVDSLKNTGELPLQYITKHEAKLNGWSSGKAVGNTNPGKQLGGDIFRDDHDLLPKALGREWREVDIGINENMKRSKQPGTRLVYSNDGLLFITTDHYKSFYSIGEWK